MGCIAVPRDEARTFGVMDIDASDRIVGFLEKPENPPGMPGTPISRWRAWASTRSKHGSSSRSSRGTRPTRESGHDFGKDIIPFLVREAKAIAHPLDRSCIKAAPGRPAYWRDVGTLDAYFGTNIDLTEPEPDLDLYDKDWPIWTYSEMTPPAKFVR